MHAPCRPGLLDGLGQIADSSELWARVCLLLDKFRCLIDFVRALEGTEGKIS